MRYLVTGRIDDQKGYNAIFKIILFSDVKSINDKNRSVDPLHEDIYRQLKKEIESDDRNIAFKYFHIESIEEAPIKWVENYLKF